MIKIKTIKPNLVINGIQVRSLDELRCNFSPEITTLYKNGTLQKWLKSKNFSEITEKLEGLSNQTNGAQLVSLCEIFSIDINEILKNFITRQQIKYNENIKPIENQNLTPKENSDLKRDKIIHEISQILGENSENKKMEVGINRVEKFAEIYIAACNHFSTKEKMIFDSDYQFIIKYKYSNQPTDNQ